MTTKANNEKSALSREQYKKSRPDGNKEAKQTEPEKEGKRKRRRIRLIPIWLRVILVGLLVAGGIALGLIIGYSILGDGERSDVFEKETWTHITDIISGE